MNDFCTNSMYAQASMEMYLRSRNAVLAKLLFEKAAASITGLITEKTDEPIILENTNTYIIQE